MTPVRIQRKRTKGWRAPFGTINCTRPGRYGNPFKIVGDMVYGNASHRRKVLPPWIYLCHCPYGLGKEPDAIKLLQDWIDHGYHEIKNTGGFMGKKWDSFVPQPRFWKEVFRVLKPGGHLLAFFGTRTYDWGTLAIRIAGFEVRDAISWLYASGFPKSLDVAKSLDKKAGIDREDKYEGAIGRRVGPTGNKKCDTCGKWLHSSNPCVCARPQDDPQTDKAKEFKGWGTALKPAQELICVARKPIEKTVADNVLKHGTGGINIDACRIEYKSEDDLKSATFGTRTNILGGNYVGSKLTDGRKNVEADPTGRFPSNVILDPFMGNELDKQTGTLTSGNPSGIRKATNNIYGQFAPGMEITGYGDSGGASRFFYTAKASQHERNSGCDHLAKSQDGFKNASGRGISERNPYSENEVANTHPTVKPIALMQYLLRLVTPPGGKTLDPFAGSGTTGCAAYFEDIGEIVLMELDEQGTYIPIIEARTKYWSIPYNRKKFLEDIKDKPVEQPVNQMKMF